MSTNALSTLIAAASRKVEVNKGKLIFGFDATYSRARTWAMAQELQRKMFSAVKRLDVQLAVFRGMDDFLVSSWESEPAKLEDLMSQIDCIGGNTQIERLLLHIMEEHKKNPRRGVNAFVFIGDTFEESGRRGNILATCKALGDLKIPGFFFLERAHSLVDDLPLSHHEAIYRLMASTTGGAFAYFDANSAEVLSDLLQSVAAYAAGGLAALESRDSKAARLLLTQMRK